MLQGRIRHLEKMHTDLDNRIDTLEKTGVFDDMQLQRLKKEKLAVLDELSQLRRQQWERDHETVEFDDER